MAIQHPSQIGSAISHLPETAYGTRRASGDTYRRIIGASQSVFDDTITKGNNQGHETGSDMPTEYWSENANAGWTTDPQVNFVDIGYQLHMAMGGYAVSGPSGGLYTHTFTMQDSSVSRQLPSRTAIKYFGGLGLDVATSMVSDSLVINIPRQGRIGTSQAFMGNGFVETDPAGYALPAMTSDREFGYASQASGLTLSVAGAGTKQVETTTAAGSASTSANLNAIVTAAGMTGSPVTVAVAVTSGDTAAQWADKVRVALRANSVINSFFEVSGSTTSIVLTARVRAANDATMNLEIDPLTTGVTASASSANTTAGVAGTYEPFACNIDGLELHIETPQEGDGRTICAQYLTPGNPQSGSLKTEHLFGVRNLYAVTTARDPGNSNLRTWLQSDTDLEFELPIIGSETNDFSLRFLHTRGRVTEATRVPEVNGFIGKRVRIDFLAAAAGDGTIPFSAVLVNNWPSYVS